MKTDDPYAILKAAGAECPEVDDYEVQREVAADYGEPTSEEECQLVVAVAYADAAILALARMVTEYYTTCHQLDAERNTERGLAAKYKWQLNEALAMLKDHPRDVTANLDRRWKKHSGQCNA